MYTQWVAIGSLGWYVFLTIVTTIGTVQIFRHYTSPPHKAVSSRLALEYVPHVTVIRPSKGLEPFLYECLAAIFHQDYPSTHLTVHLCVSSRSDSAYPVLQQLVQDYKNYDVHLFVEDEDLRLQGAGGKAFGPNPKIRNMSRAYREAKGDIVWILDCNIWVGYGALGRMVDKLCGFVRPADTGLRAQTKRPYKLVAHLPVCVDVDDLMSNAGSQNPRLRSESTSSVSATDDLTTVPFFNSSMSIGTQVSKSIVTGSRLETSFLSTAHAKMYVAINSVSVAPCINGKSTMFRKSHLNSLTRDGGIDYFSQNICEDHLIGDLLWKSSIPGSFGFEGTNSEGDELTEIQKSNPRQLSYRNHGLAVGDLAIQPMAGMSVTAYVARRVRWLRVRKYTVALATLVEPGTESFVCNAYGAFGVTTIPEFQKWFGSSWTATLGWWLTGVTYWFVVDWFVSNIILGMGSVEYRDRDQPRSPAPPASSSSSEEQRINPAIPPFAKLRPRKFLQWLPAWLGRESLALSIWVWAICGGTTVTWRERKFWVGMDMKVHEILPVDGDHTRTLNGDMNGRSKAVKPE